MNVFVNFQRLWVSMIWAQWKMQLCTLPKEQYNTFKGNLGVLWAMKAAEVMGAGLGFGREGI